MPEPVRGGSLVRLRAGWFALPAHDERAAAAVRDGGVLACRPFGGSLRTATRAVDPVPVALAYAARCLSDEEWIAVGDSYLNLTGKTRADLRSELRGAGRTVERRIAKTDRRAQSGTESIARVRLRSAGFDVTVQPYVESVGWADLRIGRLLIECDSVLHHTTRTGYANDRRRDRRALVDGWLTLRLTYDDVLYGWDAVLADIKAVTARDRHRACSAKHRAMLQRSVRMSTGEGTSPEDGSDGTDLSTAVN
ncbi:hypothetical protein ACK8HH_04915 [Gordonia sp. LUNF6]|uniref:hypothetical protein n=1 Tax=Gordonia sp. LUNF6 TaxID=3388658 RepID=UPI00399AF139